jgi:hypothetical protein
MAPAPLIDVRQVQFLSTFPIPRQATGYLPYFGPSRRHQARRLERARGLTFVNTG